MIKIVRLKLNNEEIAVISAGIWEDWDQDRYYGCRYYALQYAVPLAMLYIMFELGSYTINYLMMKFPSLLNFEWPKLEEPEQKQDNEL